MDIESRVSEKMERFDSGYWNIMAEFAKRVIQFELQVKR